MLHWLPALSGLVATRPGLRVALGTATILLVFMMAIPSLVRAVGGPMYPHQGLFELSEAERGPLGFGRTAGVRPTFWQCWTSIKEKN